MSQRLPSIITHYKKWKAENPDTWIEHCKSQKTLADAIHFSALSENNAGKRHKHQYRLQRENLALFEASLLAREIELLHTTTFEALIEIIKEARTPGIGELAIYDTAVRIAAYLGLEPDKIYLHAGTRIGVSKLIGQTNASSISKDQLPDALRNSNLSCYELEDLLCIYKDKF
jgi:hypothetical protein